MFLELYAKTDVGRVRNGNEDNFLVLDLSTLKACTGSEGGEIPSELQRFNVGPSGAVLIVSDGMGGALAGDVASRLAVETVRDRMLENRTDGDNSNGGPNSIDTSLIARLKEAVLNANLTIHDQSQKEARYSGMGATLTGAAVTPNGIDFVQVGDSRAYVIRGAEIRLATKDQSLVQQLVDVGQISEQEAETHMFRNVILQALGAQAELLPVTGGVRCRNQSCRLHRGDTLLLCSDGLSGKLRADEMREIVEKAGDDLQAACSELVAEANARGGEDNITVILARLTGEDVPANDSHKVTVELPEIEDDSTIGMEDDTETP